MNNTLAKLIFLGIMMIVMIMSVAFQIAALPQTEQIVAFSLVTMAIIAGMFGPKVTPTAAKYHKIALFYRMNILFLTMFLIYKVFSMKASVNFDIYLIIFIVFNVAALILMQNSEAILEKKEKEESEAQIASY